MDSQGEDGVFSLVGVSLSEIPLLRGGFARRRRGGSYNMAWRASSLVDYPLRFSKELFFTFCLLSHFSQGHHPGWPVLSPYIR